MGDKIGDSPITKRCEIGKSVKLKYQGTIQLVPKMVMIIPRRRRGTWKGVPVATWCSGWICRMWAQLGHLGPHILIIPASLSLPPMRGAPIGRAPTILENDLFYTRISCQPLRVSPPDPRPLGRESRQFFDFLGRELTFFRNSLQGEGREWKKET